MITFWRPGLTFREVKFTPHPMLELDEHLSIRRALVVFENGYNSSILTMIPDRNGLHLINGNAFIPTYEVYRLGELRTYQTPQMIEEDLRLTAMLPPISANDMIEKDTLVVHDSFDYRIYGCFIYLPNQGLHEVWFSYDKWNEFKYPRDVIRRINIWCGLNLSDEFAWCGHGPMWAFKSKRDAILFKLKWI